MIYPNLKILIDTVTEIVESHAQIEMCRWGVISDISNPKDGLQPKYPYFFGIIDTVNFTRAQYLVNVTAIFQTQCEDTQEAVLQAQSDMAEIAHDIYSKLVIQSGSDGPISINKNIEISGVPFVERFQDTVAGVTITFPFELDNPASKCYFPLKNG